MSLSGIRSLCNRLAHRLRQWQLADVIPMAQALSRTSGSQQANVIELHAALLRLRDAHYEVQALIEKIASETRKNLPPNAGPNDMNAKAPSPEVQAFNDVLYGTNTPQPDDSDVVKLESEGATIRNQLAEFKRRQAAVQTDIDAKLLANPDAPDVELRPLLDEKQTLALRITAVQKRLEANTLEAKRVRAAIAAEKLESEWQQVSRLLDERDAAIDDVEDLLAQAAVRFKECMAATQQAINASPDPLRGHIRETISEALDLVPAMTQRFWLQLNFRHPAIPVFDTYGGRVGRIKDIFASERKYIERR